MLVICEGPDGSGKSTLAEYLAKALNFSLQPSEGRPRTSDEMHARISRYARMDNVVFDRHTIISQMIYAQIRNTAVEDMPNPLEIHCLAQRRPFIIYCRAEDLKRHVAKAHDTPEHLQAVQDNFKLIVRLYDSWALDNAHLIYRIGDSMRMIAAMAHAYRYC